MEYILLFILIVIAVVSYLIHKKNMELLRMVSSPDRGTYSERRLIIKMLRKGVHPKAIFHDLYVKRKNGQYSQIDLVVATPQGLLAIEVKDYSGWIFGSERQKYWTQILNYGKEKYRFYNPIMQNEGHIKALREQSEQFSVLPIYNIVLFAGDCTLKDISYISENRYVGYTSEIMQVIKTVKGFCDAGYTDKREVARVLNKAVRDGENPEIVSNHLFMAQSAARNNPQPVINRGLGLYINWRRLLRF